MCVCVGGNNCDRNIGEKKASERNMCNRDKYYNNLLSSSTIIKQTTSYALTFQEKLLQKNRRNYSRNSSSSTHLNFYRSNLQFLQSFPP